MDLPPYQLINTPAAWQTCLQNLGTEPRLAIDLEANSMFAYRERVCLIQISIPNHDFIIDPLAKLDLEPFGELIADAAVEKIFHAAEYDLMLLKREFDWDLTNLFDTMWAARILGYRRYGLASILKKLYGVQLNKRFQKSNWCKRPLSPAQLTYAQLDTHYLLALRAHLGDELAQTGRVEEAQEVFSQQTKVKLPNIQFDPDSFWSINGVNHLNRQQQAILKALNIYRDKEARYRNRPPFKILSDKTLLELAQKKPRTFPELQHIYGMTPGQIKRFGKYLLEIIADDPKTLPSYPKRRKRPSERTTNRYEKLHNWRKSRAQARGVESDVILSRHVLWQLAEVNPQTLGELTQIDDLGEWHSRTYGEEILNILRN